MDFSTLERPTSPNTYLLAPEGICQAASPDVLSPRFAESPKELFKLLTRLVRSDGRARDMLEDPDGPAIRFVAVTPLLRFKDDVDIRIYPDQPGGSLKKPGARLAIYSRSRVGYSDLGANAKRVSRLIEKLQAATLGT
ncbi:MAG: DUF1499 domain-containing protein [Hyphomonadaceae bacterium]|nr:DUF1499 domain-containing protein [Hyphomonadaceae bacterium]